ncbi:carboxy terminal-processing peptidase [Porticoccaceae bacterium]|nr:carboxy terminal-processing peptidase [Porticoccaceae bacterium]
MLHQFLKTVCVFAFVLLAQLASGSEQTQQAPSAGTAVVELNDTHPELFNELLEELDERHFVKIELDNVFSAQLLERFLERLDGGKNYFLLADIEKAQSQWRNKLDDALKQSNLKPAEQLYNLWRQRALARIEQNIALLETPLPLPEQADTAIELDADKRSWFSSTAQADAFWQLRLAEQLGGLMLADKTAEEAQELLIKRYRNQLKRVEQFNATDLFSSFANAVTSIYDPHTDYMSPRSEENFKINMSLSLEGIGAVLQIEDEFTQVVRVIPGGPADAQGILQAEDKIVGVGQEGEDVVDVVGWRLDDVVDLIRGPKDSQVTLQIIPTMGEFADQQREITITRDKVKLEDQAASGSLVEISKDSERASTRIGVIELPAFYFDFEAYRQRDPDYKSSTRDVYNLLREMAGENVDGIILDLRSNGGGSLHEATTMTDLFVEPGPVVQIKNADNKVDRRQRARSAAVYNGPLVVLVDRLSASASEILAGALQDYQRALIVGSQTYGKGTVQDITGLSSGQVKLTISKYYRISGDSTQNRGVVPDVALPSLWDSSKIGERERDNALPWDTIHPVSHRLYPSFDDYLPDLRQRHLQRQQTKSELIRLTERLELEREWDQNTQVLVNLDARQAQKQQREEALLAIENRHRVRRDLEPYSDVESWRKVEKADDKESVDQSSDSGSTDDSTEKEELVTVSADDDPLLIEAAYVLADLIQLTK